MKIKLSSKGDFSKSIEYLTNLKKLDMKKILEKYGQLGLDALLEATPKRTGLTSRSWEYKVSVNGKEATNKVSISGVVDTSHIGEYKLNYEIRNGNFKTNQELIQAVLDKGYTKDDIMDVIYLKYDQWIENNDKNKKDMSTYYRPSTILGEKFEEYLQEAKMKGIS